MTLTRDGKMAKLKRDEKGTIILNGSKTFGDMICPKPNKCPRTHRLKSDASTRILLLMKKGRDADILAKKPKPLVDKMEIEYLQFQNKLARQPAVVQFAYHRNKLKELIEELKNLRESGNSRKLKLSEPTIIMEMKELEQQLKDLGEIIINEKKFISRSTNG